MASTTRGRVDPETAVCLRYPTVARGWTRTLPSSGIMWPEITWRRVDFPTPFAPTIPTRSPELIFQSTVRPRGKRWSEPLQRTYTLVQGVTVAAWDTFWVVGLRVGERQGKAGRGGGCLSAFECTHLR